VRLQFNNANTWKDCVAELVKHNIDFACGNSENPFIVIYNRDSLDDKLFTCGFSFNPYEA
jgi:hypothetical protein